MRTEPNVPVVFGDQFPSGYLNEVAGWGCFPRSVVEQERGKLLMLDIDFGRRCALNCPHCFRHQNRADLGSDDLAFDEICEVIVEGKGLGLRSVKFLGAGEPLEAPRFAEFLRFLQSQDITPAIFTKGHVIGDDQLARRYFGSEGVECGHDLAELLYELGTSILLGFNSFDPAKQDVMVGRIEGYTLKRNRALEILVAQGFNGTLPTRLALGANPVTPENLGEVFDIYAWARRCNLYCVICPTMVSGRCRENWRSITPSEDELVDLYTRIYQFNLETGLQTLDQVREEGVAAYAGGQPCNQVGCGMYVTLTGTVLRCPGDDTTVLGDLRQQSLEEIWRDSENYRRAGCFNCGCPPKIGRSLPTRLFERVLRNLLEH